jgi:translation initiation factor RLI1
MKLAMYKEKCKQRFAVRKCKKACPIEKKELDSCVTIEDKSKIDENSCNGCGICQKRCPLEQIEIINLPSIKEKI